MSLVTRSKGDQHIPLWRFGWLVMVLLHKHTCSALTACRARGPSGGAFHGATRERCGLAIACQQNQLQLHRQRFFCCCCCLSSPL